MDLDDVLSDKPPEQIEEQPDPAEQPAEQPKPDSEGRKAFQEKEAAAQAEGRARDAAGKFTSAETPEKEPEPPKPEPPKPPQEQLTDKERAFLARATDETRKRQQLEQEIAQLRAQQPPKTPETPKAFWDDPEGALSAFEQRMLQQQQMQQQTFTQQRIAASESIARGRYQDFDQMVPLFGEILQQTPGLYETWVRSPDPAEFAYKSAKNLKELREAGSLDTIRQNAEKEARIKLEAEYKEKEAKLLKEREALPESLSNVRGTSNPRITWGGPPPLDDVFKH